MSKHKQTRPPIRWKLWTRYLTYRLALALINTRTKAIAKALQTKTNHNTKPNQKKF